MAIEQIENKKLNLEVEILGQSDRQRTTLLPTAIAVSIGANPQVVARTLGLSLVLTALIKMVDDGELITPGQLSAISAFGLAFSSWLTSSKATTSESDTSSKTPDNGEGRGRRNWRRILSKLGTFLAALWWALETFISWLFSLGGILSTAASLLFRFLLASDDERERPEQDGKTQADDLQIKDVLREKTSEDDFYGILEYTSFK